MSKATDGEPEEARNFVKPTLSFESITFSDGQQLAFEADEIIVFVGPNNAGKSAALRELQNWITKATPQNVITEATLRKRGTAEDLAVYLEENAQKHGDPLQFSYAGIGYSIHPSHISWFDQPSDRHPVASFFSHRLATEDRITGSDPAGAVALYQDPPSHPIHLLLMDDHLAARIGTLFRRAFGRDLIVFRAGGSQYPLFVGEKPDKSPDEDELSKSFVDRLRAAAEPLQTQGDGMRSFATVMLYVLVASHHSVLFLDEPEAFLHPPQARLVGEYIARERKTESQLFIATHSTDVLDGLIAGGSSKVRIIRIQRDGSVNRIKELSKEKTAAIARDTLTRYSGVFQGIFYQHVIITESDSDCMFYSAILKTEAVSGDTHPDVLFIHAAGKHRMAALAETLRSLDVPVSVVADVDILNEEGAFRKLYETVGGQWSDVEGHWRAIKTAVEALRPPLTGEQLKGLIEAELAPVGGIAPFPKQTERNIKAIFKTVSPWDAVKQSGRSALRGGGTVSHYDQLTAKCSSVGLWIVPVGELEGFCRSVQGSHGPGFVEQVLEVKDLERDPELHEAREFVRSIWNAAK